MVHRDLKSENILICMDGSIRICDLGFVTNLPAGKSQQMKMAGTYRWVAPEIFQHNTIHFGADVWSIGCITYELIQKKTPFADDSTLKAIFQISTIGGPVVDYSEIDKEYSTEIESFLDCCLQSEPELRLNCNQLLTHIFLTKISKNSRVSQKFVEKLIISQSLKNINGY